MSKELLTGVLYYPFYVHGICSDVPAVISLSNLRPLFFLFFLVTLARGLLILMIFSENQLLVPLIFSNDFLFSNLMISRYINCFLSGQVKG